MSEDRENQQEDFSSQESDDSSVSEELDVGGNVSESDGEETVEETESEPKDDKVVLTQADLDKKMQREREVAKRQARREYERKITSDAEKNQQQQSVQNQVPIQQQNTDQVWDDNLKSWIPKNLTIGEYEQWINSGVKPNNPVQQPQATVQAQAQTDKSKTVNESLSEDAENQAIECQADFDDFSDVIKSAALTPSMVNAASNDKNGIKNLYEMQKNNPQKLFEISRLPRDKQQYAVWKLNEELRRNKTKVMSSATKQPKTLGSSKMIKDDWGSMSDGDLKKKLQKY